MEISQLWAELTKGLSSFTPGNAFMIAIGAVLIALASAIAEILDAPETRGMGFADSRAVHDDVDLREES